MDRIIFENVFTYLHQQLRDAMYGLYSLLFLTSLVKATSITDIQGTSFSSPLVGQTVHNVTGVVTAKVCRCTLLVVLILSI